MASRFERFTPQPCNCAESGWLDRDVGCDSRNCTVRHASETLLGVGALAASASERVLPINPYTAIGVTSRVQNWDNPLVGTDAQGIYTDPCSSALSIYDVQPWQPGFYVKAHNDSTDGTMYQGRYNYQPEFWNYSSGPYGGPYAPRATCPENMGVASDYVSDGIWETTATGNALGVRSRATQLAAPHTGRQARNPRVKETLRSRGNYNYDGGMSGIGYGLGSTWIDPRYEPGPQCMYPGASNAWAAGTYAGGPTGGAWIPSAFRPGPQWSIYVQGFGDGTLIAPGWREANSA